MEQALSLAQKDYTANVIASDNSSKKIPLAQGLFAIVDAVDYDYLSQWKWYPRVVNNGCIATRMDRSTSIYMHREVAKLHSPEEAIPPLEHRNGNKLDNRWSNLRPKKSILNSKVVCGVESLRERIQREKVQDLKVQRLKIAFLISEAIETAKQAENNAALLKEQLEEILLNMKP